MLPINALVSYLSGHDLSNNLLNLSSRGRFKNLEAESPISAAMVSQSACLDFIDWFLKASSNFLIGYNIIFHYP